MAAILNYLFRTGLVRKRILAILVQSPAFDNPSHVVYFIKKIQILAILWPTILISPLIISDNRCFVCFQKPFWILFITTTYRSFSRILYVETNNNQILSCSNLLLKNITQYIYIAQKYYHPICEKGSLAPFSAA